ncbi:hypothetical protein MP228_010364 [Amoeboaphelidium protococcarum]|nr:hypothetical protein MP228_010364 [Amoeboaphelidium protococcarum]
MPSLSNDRKYSIPILSETGGKENAVKSLLTSNHIKGDGREEDAITQESLKHGFTFSNNKYESVDWRLLSSVSVEKIQEKVDITSLQTVLRNLAHCNIENERLDGVDPNFVKLFKLAQMSIEYLLHSQNYLINKHQSSVSNSQGGNGKHKQSLTQLEQESKEKSEQISSLRKEVKALKRTVYAYQLWSKIPGGVNPKQPVVAAYFRCKHCPKVFNSEYYLECHLDRRHGDQPNYIKESMEEQIQSLHNKSKVNNVDVVDKITSTIERFSTKIMETERSLRTDMENKLQSEVARREQQLEKSYREEIKKLEKTLAEYKSSINKQVDDEKKLLNSQRLDQAEDKKRDQQILKRIDDRFAEILFDLQEEVHDEISGLKEDLSMNQHQILSQFHADQQHQNDNNLEEFRVSPIEEEPPVVEQQKEQFDPNKWDGYLNVMNSFKAKSLKRFPELKSKYQYDDATLKQQKNKIKLMLNQSVKDDLDLTTMSDQDAIDMFKARVMDQVIDSDGGADKSNPYSQVMKSFISNQVDNIAVKNFKPKIQKPNLSVQTSLPPTIKSSQKKWDFMNGSPAPNMKDTEQQQSRAPSPTKSIGSMSMRSAFSVVDWNKKSGKDDDLDTISDLTDDDKRNQSGMSNVSNTRMQSPTTGNETKQQKASLKTVSTVMGRALSAFKKSHGLQDAKELAANRTDDVDVSDVTDSDAEQPKSSAKNVKPKLNLDIAKSKRLRSELDAGDDDNDVLNAEI